MYIKVISFVWIILLIFSVSNYFHLCYKIVKILGHPWWLSGKKSALQSWRCGFNPWSGKIPYAAEQLSPCPTTAESVLQSSRVSTTEPTCCNYWSPLAVDPVLHKRSHHNEKPAHPSWRVAPTRCNYRKAHEAMKTQHSQKQRMKFF